MIGRLIPKAIKEPLGHYWNMTNGAYRYLMQHGKNPVQPVEDSAAFTRSCADRAVEWFLFHQKSQPDGGVTAHVWFNKGKTRLSTSYPEVTGYIIPSLFNYAKEFDRPDVREAAIRAADFELPLQEEGDGWFPGGRVGDYRRASVFNSGMIIDGLVRAYRETKEDKYLESAQRAGRWIRGQQEASGVWGAGNYLGMKRTYDTKVCEYLCEIDKAAGTTEFTECVRKNLQWVYRHQEPNGWFRNCDNSYPRNNEPLTHTIGYTTQGLLECYHSLGDEEIFKCVEKPLKALLHRAEVHGFPLGGRYDSNWKPTVSSTCVTGNAQIALCWFDMHKITGDNRYLNAALKMNDYQKSIQLRCSYPEVNGGFSGSHPFWGDYDGGMLQSWPVKYQLDAYLIELKVRAELGEKV